MHALEEEAPPAVDAVGFAALDAEDGAQAVEYAMIGGLGAGVIGLLWTIISRTGLVEKIVNALLTSLVDLINSWF